MPSDLTGGGVATDVAVLPGFEAGECTRGTEWGNRYPWSRPGPAGIEPAAHRRQAEDRADWARSMGFDCRTESREVVTYTTVWTGVDRG